MNTLVEKAIEIFENSKITNNKELHEKAKKRIKECFGEYADNNLIETEKPCYFRIKNTNWDLVYGFYNGFTLWHKDIPDITDFKNPNHCKFNASQIIDMKSLGESLSSVKKTWGL